MCGVWGAMGLRSWVPRRGVCVDVLMFVIIGVVILVWPIRRSLCGGSVDVIVCSCAVSSDSSMMVSGVVVFTSVDTVKSGSLTEM